MPGRSLTAQGCWMPPLTAAENTRKAAFISSSSSSSSFLFVKVKNPLWILLLLLLAKQTLIQVFYKSEVA